IDTLGLVHYLYQSSVPTEASVLRGFRKLGPGQCLIAEGGTVTVRDWYRLPAESIDAPPTLDAAAEVLDARLTAAVRSHLVADVPVGAFLSGGLDSAAISAAAR